MFQDPSYLSMIGMGALNIPGLDKGIHLRWQFPASLDLGFPKYGFDLFRREHVSLDPVCYTWIGLSVGGETTSVTIKDAATGLKCKITSDNFLNTETGPDGRWSLHAGLGGTITIEFEEYLRELAITENHKMDAVEFKAYDDNALVSVRIQEVTGTMVETVITADRFNKVVIYFTEDIYIYMLCWLSVASEVIPSYHKLKDGSAGWTFLDNFRLPKSWGEASSRIPVELHPKLKGGFPELKEIIAQLSNASVDYPELIASQDPEAHYTLYPMATLLLLSFNTVIARMIGLYFIDKTAKTGTSYDYLIAGKWEKLSKIDHTWICYDKKLVNPDPLPSINGLTVSAKKLSFKNDKTTQTGVSLRWEIPNALETLWSDIPAMYHVYRKVNEASGWSADVALTGNKPLIIGFTTGNSPYYIDGGIL